MASPFSLPLRLPAMVAVLLAPASNVMAEPLTIAAEEAAAPAGPPGEGACGHARHKESGWLGNLDEALILLNGPLLQGESEHRFKLVTPDYTNGTPVSNGDFTANLGMPFSPIGNPFGDGQRIAMRWFGQLRVASAGTMTFAIRSDDGFRLTIGETVVLDHPSVQTPKVASQVVVFESAGRYPFELLYFENLTDAVIEWSVAPGAQEEVFESPELPPGGFTLVPTNMLVIPNDDPNACGASCVLCEGSTPFCVQGKCTADLAVDGGAGGGGGSGWGGSSGYGGFAAEGGMGGFGGSGDEREPSYGGATDVGGSTANEDEAQVDSTPSLRGTTVCSAPGVGLATSGDESALIVGIAALFVRLRRRSAQ